MSIERNIKKTVRPAFTLMEMMVSLAVFSVVTGLVIANFRTGNQSDDLRIAQQLVASAVRRAQTAALAGEVVSYCQGGVNDGKLCPVGTCPAPGVCQRGVPTGYGIHFSTAADQALKMIFFADVMSAAAPNGNRVYDAGEEVRIDSVSPTLRVAVSGLTLAPSGGAPGALDIVFVPPKPTTYFNAATVDATAAITVRQSSTGRTRTVTVNRITGQVSAQ